MEAFNTPSVDIEQKATSEFPMPIGLCNELTHYVAKIWEIKLCALLRYGIVYIFAGNFYAVSYRGSVENCARHQSKTVCGRWEFAVVMSCADTTCCISSWFRIFNQLVTWVRDRSGRPSITLPQYCAIGAGKYRR